MIGTELAHYQITAHLGSGGMGEVYQATDSKLGRSVAIKLLPEAFSHDPERVARLDREARVLASMNHVNIATIYGVEESGGRKFLVMELVPGETLARRIERGRIPVNEALRIAQQVADALEAAHEKAVIHRDLKPANIKITPEGQIKVLDFGLAVALADSAVDSSDSPTLSITNTKAGMIMGTPAYMPPEQALGKKTDRSGDMWAFGCVLYEALAGGVAFSGEATSDVLARVLKDDPDWQRLPTETPESIRRLLRRCLEKDERRRIRDMRDARIEIEEARNEKRDISPIEHRRYGVVIWAALGMMILLAVAFYLVMARARAMPVPGLVRFHVYAPQNSVFNGPVNTTVGQPQFAVSADGRTLAFVAARAGGRPMIWVRSMDDPTSRALPGTENGEYPFWSAEGDSVGFFANGRMKKVHTAAGPVQVVAEEATSDPRGGSWHANGTILFGTGASTIFSVPTSGGSPEPVTKLDAAAKEVSHRWPHFLPDGRHFIFTVRSDSPDRQGIYVASLDGKVKKFLIRNDASALFISPGLLLYLDGDTLLAQAFDLQALELKGRSFVVAEGVGRASNGFGSFSAATTGTLAYSPPNLQIGRLTWFDRKGNELGSVGPERDYTDVRLSPDEKRLAVSLVDPKTGYTDIWLMDLERENLAPFTRGPAVNSGPVWSPDSSLIMFRTTRRGGVAEFFVKSSGGAGTENAILTREIQRTAGGESLNLYISDWSSDNILYSVVASSGWELWLMSLQDRKPQRLLRSSSVGMHANFSPIGGLISYGSDESGQMEIYVQTFPLSDRKTLVSSRGGYEPRWRRDGRELYYLALDGKLMVVPMNTDLSFDEAKPLFQTKVPAGVSGFRTHYVVSDNGERFLIISQLSDLRSEPITVMLNWAVPAQ